MAEKNLQQLHIEAEPEFEETPFYQDVNFDWRNLFNKEMVIHHTVKDAATAGNYGVFWIAPFECVVKDVQEAHQTAGSDSGDVGLNLEKLSDGTALDSGTEILSSDIDLKATANTVQSGTLSRADKRILKGQRLALKDSGTLTDVDNVTVIVVVKIKR